MTVKFRVDGDPKPQPRVRRSRQGGVYTPTTADGWRMLIAAAIRELNLSDPTAWRLPLGDHIHMSMTFMFRRPKSHMGKRGLRKSAPVHHTSKPDVDNLCKLVMDVCTQMRVYNDDSQVIGLSASKRFARNDELPGVSVCLW